MAWAQLPAGLTRVAALVHHEHVGSNADHAADVTLELAVGQADATGGVGLRPASIAVAQRLR